jgi:signal transduction histidine kinase
MPIVAEFDVHSRSDGRAGTELVGVLPLDRLRIVCRCPEPLPAAVAPGSRVRVEGVCRVTATKRHEFFAQPGAFDIWPASAADVVVIRAARWWTTRRLATTLGIATTVLAAALGWVALLRRQVAKQARDLATTMQSQHDATLEFETALRERNRLAANLHDTVLQTVTGIGYQLQAVQAIGSRAGGHDAGRLAVAGRMVDHAIQQLRGTVWALHTQPGGGQPLAASLEALVARLGEGRDARIDLRVEGKETEVSEFVAGNLLLLVQEAITNALKHAAATRIEVTAAFGGDGALAVTIRDDGRGFRPGTQPGPAQGHFGIEAMMDRMQAVGGRLAIESRDGRGTTVTALVPPAAADDLSDRAGGPVAVDG